MPDAIDQGEKPFIRPFMIDMADDHYALDIGRARDLLDWQPTHAILETLPKIVQALKDDPLGWYRANGITPPPWLETAARPSRIPKRCAPTTRRAIARSTGASSGRTSSISGSAPG